jgi:hypothetical protein
MTIEQQAEQISAAVLKGDCTLSYLEDQLRNAFNFGQLRACELRGIPVTLSEIEEEGMKR